MELPEHRVLREGIVAGLLGGAVVAGWFLIVDTLAGRPFVTPVYLWDAVFTGFREPHTALVTARAVFGYTLLHFFAFSAFGVLCAMLIAAADQDSAYVLASLALFASFQLFLLGLTWFLSTRVVQLLWWEVFVANLLASSAMVLYFFLGRRALGASLIGGARRELREGLLAGLIGAALVAVWFLILDVAQGQPFRTPALLGAAIFQGLHDPTFLRITPPLVLGYTALHVVAFALFGILCAIVIAALEREPILLWAFLALFACFEVFFFVLQGLMGSVLGALAGWSVVAGNLLASAGMLGYFFVGHRALGGHILGRHGVPVREGIAAGLVGAGVVALWFLLYDIAKGQPLKTPALLGAALFQSIAARPAPARADLADIAGYTLVHVLAFVIFGIVAAFFVVAAERQPLLLIGLFMLFAAFEVFFFGLVLILAESLLGALVWWAIFIGNLLAAAAMLVYFFFGHRALGRHLTHPWPGEEETT